MRLKAALSASLLSLHVTVATSEFKKDYSCINSASIATDMSWSALLLHGALLRLPRSKRLTVIGVTGTKGKIVRPLKCSLRYSPRPDTKRPFAGTIRFAIEDESRPKLLKMTLPGRGFIQKFLRRSAYGKLYIRDCRNYEQASLHTSHLGSSTLTGLSSRTSNANTLRATARLKKYVAAKRAIVETLVRSPKRSRTLVANTDILESRAFLSAAVSKAIGFSASELKNISGDERSVRFEYSGIHFSLPIPGAFNAMNALAAIKPRSVWRAARNMCGGSWKTFPHQRARGTY